MLKTFFRSSLVQSTGAWLLGQYLRWTLTTTRWRIIGEDYLRAHVDGPPCIVSFWHERLPLMPALWAAARRMGARNAAHVLVSRHRDGRFIGSVISHVGLDVIYGSSAKPGRPSSTASKGGATGVRLMLDVLERGDYVAITPDGPRGPRREAKLGVAQLGGLSGMAVLPCAAQTSRRRILRSWDRMVVPLPFARGVIVCGQPIAVPRDGWEGGIDTIQQALTAVAEEADRQLSLAS